MFEKFESVRRFISVAEKGTLHAAAASLGLTQPALTRSIKLLEADFGAPLFERHPRGLRLTALGERALRHARHIMRECQLAESDLQALRTGESGSLSIAAGPVWMSSILPFVIARLHENYPRFQFQLASINYALALSGLQNGDLDLFCGGFQRDVSLPSFLIRRPLFSVRLSVVARSDHPILKMAQAGPDELLSFPWLSYQSDVAYLDTIMEPILEQTGRRANAIVRCESMLTVLALMREGDYLAFLPGSFITSVPGLNLRVVDTNITDVTFESGVIFRRSLLSNPAFRHLLDVTNERIAAIAGNGMMPRTVPSAER